MNDESRKWELFKAWQGLVARFPVFQECTYSKFQAVVEQFANAWRPFAIRSQMVRVFVAERSSARGNRSEGSAGEGGGDDRGGVQYATFDLVEDDVGFLSVHVCVSFRQ